MFIFSKALGLADLPITIRGSLLFPDALLQAMAVSRCLSILNPGAEFSPFDARLFVGCTEFELKKFFSTYYSTSK